MVFICKFYFFKGMFNPFTLWDVPVRPYNINTTLVLVKECSFKCSWCGFNPDCPSIETYWQSGLCGFLNFNSNILCGLFVVFVDLCNSVYMHSSRAHLSNPICTAVFSFFRHFVCTAGIIFYYLFISPYQNNIIQ